MSEERSKISLRKGPKRKNRLVISSPKQISAPILNDGPEFPKGMAGLPAAISGNDSSPRPRAPPTRGKTGDLVKQRYSTRFNNLPADFDAERPPLPSMPAIPNIDLVKYGQAANLRSPPLRGADGGPPIVDTKALRDPRLIPDQYVANILSEATEDEIKEYEDALRKLKVRAVNDLQQNVYQNRTQFIKISKEAEKLKREMRSLRNLFKELETNTNALRAASGKGGPGGELSAGLSKRDKRSSVADRTALWNTQMQLLYKSIEGSQKFLPNSMGRHIIQNAGPWIELDNATYRPRRSMLIVLLNDHLLVASRRKRKLDGPNDTRGPATKLVADRCWPLLDIEVVDMASTSEAYTGKNKLSDAIMVRGVGQESFIYRTEKPEAPGGTEKTTLMLNIRKAVEELRRGLKSEMEANNKAKETINYFASRDPGLLQKTELLETLSDIKDMLIEVDGKQQNLRWVEGQMDELDIDIALQRFDMAVDRVEKLKNLARGLKNSAVTQGFINFKIEERSAKLAGFIVRELEETHDKQQKTQRNVSWLSRLGFENQARGAYLEARTDLIQKRCRQCIFQGDLHLYIWQLSFVYFHIIRNTVSCFQSCFPQPMMSACVKWAKEQVDAFNEILGRQLSSTERGGEVWNQCMEQAKTHAQVLEEVQLDFRDLVGKNVSQAGTNGAGPVGLGLT
ncbi:exocyst complex component EXO84 [Xylaria sp. CBS 124048]|nr:exocyst complex component EXO84 [Xylaria sp. CBS 124048]